MDVIFEFLIQSGIPKDYVLLLFLYVLLWLLLYLWWFVFGMSEFLGKLGRSMHPWTDALLRWAVAEDYHKRRTALSIVSEIISPLVVLWPFLFLVLLAIYNFHTKGTFI